ncbi:hypothetical protein [Variovorax sp. JS1663]|uniref:hypothetical protein n=1 Tax=Variovorax sp. JS1663 TaxID=1851577 RepID=UPI000B34373D|nr:hypothetical protein [Variovorax sp. JS1663]OUM01669.1 hypothetical protein A8M77_15460 [Variovorax sp. JS1663]
MDIRVALNGTKRRNLELFALDEVTLNVTVYAADGDAAPVAVTNLVMRTWPDDFTVPVGQQFTVPDTCPGRRCYRLQGDIAGVATTLAYGVMRIRGGESEQLGGNDYGWRWPYGGWW